MVITNSPFRVHAGDKVIGEPFRFGIMRALAAHQSLTFRDLKAILSTTDGNVCIHARKLGESGYIAFDKKFEGLIPQTTYRLTTEGRAALESYISGMSAMIRETRLVMGSTDRN